VLEKKNIVTFKSFKSPSASLSSDLGISRALLAEAQDYISDDALKDYKVSLDTISGLKAEFIFWNYGDGVDPRVTIQEKTPRGPLDLHCSQCTSPTLPNSLCLHQAAGLQLCYESLAGSEDYDYYDDELSQVEGFLKEFNDAFENQEKRLQDQRKDFRIPKDVQLKSISLKWFLPEKEASLIFKELREAPQADSFNFEIYKPAKIKDRHLPEIFREIDFAKLSRIFYRGSEELREVQRIAGLFQYHFSNGVQVNSQQILLHPLGSLVPGHLRPRGMDSTNVDLDLGPWKNVTQTHVQRFYKGHELIRTERTMQALLRRIADEVNGGKIPFYIQDGEQPTRVTPVKKIIGDLGENFVWSVTCQGSPLQATLTLKGEETSSSWIRFKEGAVDLSNQYLLIYPLEDETDNLRYLLGNYGMCERETEQSTDQSELIQLKISGQESIFHGLRMLRERKAVVQFSGGTHEISQARLISEIHLNRSGYFQLRHKVIEKDFPEISFQGLSREVCQILIFLRSGISSFVGYEAKDLAARTQPKRDWDMKLLKHLGIFQYLVLELCSVAVEGCLTDGTAVNNPTKIWPCLSGKIGSLLKITQDTGADLDFPLEKLCSVKVLEHFRSFISWFFETLEVPTTTYAHQGEFVFAGLAKKDIQVLYILLKEQALLTKGACFQKARSSFTTKISEQIEENLPSLLLDGVSTSAPVQGVFRVPVAEKSVPSFQETMNVLAPLNEKGFQFYLDGSPLQGLADGDFSIEFTLNNTGVTDWFELNPKFFLKGKELAAGAEVQLGTGGVIEYQGRLYLVPRKQIPSLSHLEGFWQRLQQGRKKNGSLSSFGAKVLPMPRSQMLELLALRASGYPVQGGKEWEDLCTFYDSLGTPRKKSIDLSSSIRAELKPYQKEGVQWLHDLYCLKLGALLGDDMGLGKTLQTLAFLETLRVQNKMGTTLIVVPPSLIYNWKSEIEKFVPDLPVRIFTTKERESLTALILAKTPLVVITTYGLLVENDVFFSAQNWNILIFDEAQNLKNITAKRTSAARSLKANFRICITGTPMENHYGEFYSLMDLVAPGGLGEIDEFRQRYVIPSVVLAEDIHHLKLKVKPLLLRRTKKEILFQLPEKQETKVSIAFERKQKKLYRDIAISYNEKIQAAIQTSGESKCQLQMLTALLRLRQACSDPSALPDVQYTQTPPKLETLLESLKEIVEANESALVFTQFLPTLMRTQQELEKAGIAVYTIHGGVSATQRQKILKEFDQHPRGAVLLMTLKTGGVGLNLTKASYVFHLEPWWNPAVENQATDRAHRMGQQKSVQVFRYIMHESVEEKIDLLKGRKDQQFKSLFSDVENTSELEGTPHRGLTKEDFALLLGGY
jgi:superfamily II DNA or RNA helicase